MKWISIRARGIRAGPWRPNGATAHFKSTRTRFPASSSPRAQPDWATCQADEQWRCGAGCRDHWPGRPAWYLPLLTVLLGIFAPNRFFLLFAIVDLASALYFYRHLIGCSEMEAGPFACWVVGMTPVGCLAILLAVLRNWADPEVRADSFLQTGFMIAWGCAVLWAHLFGSLLGLDVLDYGVRGRNVAAVWAGVGLTIGVTLAAAGANVGQGQT